MDGISYEAVDDQRCKCLTCSKVIYKLLQRAHSYSHSSTKLTQEQLIKPVITAVKKFSLQPDFIVLQKPALPISTDLPDPVSLTQQTVQNVSSEKGELIKPVEVVKNIENNKNFEQNIRVEQKKTQKSINVVDFTKNKKNLVNTSSNVEKINNKGSFLDCLKKSQSIKAYMQKSINSFYRGLFVVYLKHFRIWKKKI